MAHYQDIEPFKNGKHMRKFENELLLHGSRPKEIYMAWQIGKVCLLRVSDVLKLKVDQIYKKNGGIYDTVATRDQKTNKFNPLNLNPLKVQLSNYHDWRVAHHIKSVWMFPSATNTAKPLNRAVVYRLICRSAHMLGYKHLGCHSARKTGAYILYKSTNNLPMVSRMLNHSSEQITERYLGINDPAIKSATNNTDWESIPQ